MKLLPEDRAAPEQRAKSHAITEIIGEPKKSTSRMTAGNLAVVVFSTDHDSFGRVLVQ